MNKPLSEVSHTSSWDDMHVLHVEDVEIQHRRLLTLTDALRTAIRERRDLLIRQTMDALVQYVELHFSDEEQFMRLQRFPEIEEHRIAHREFLQRCRRLQEAAAVDPACVTEQDCDLLVAWMNAHEREEDRSYLSYSQPLLSD